MDFENAQLPSILAGLTLRFDRSSFCPVAYTNKYVMDGSLVLSRAKKMAEE